ncbi:ABC-2 type transporter [Oscillochloris trichoides DG-6]|uniref:Transport permease protein n=1 Tax=Oscillochloris trichoides DG-6 TaxID=765420 RepID=E1ICL8_9CHLR|nr:ABC transporter permease [Oscillochloris trichoides]EFO81038.1 ABC-2 type transporter [Oscillochloris trichoides DG-6]
MHATYVIWSKHMTKFWRSTEELLGLALQSVLWVVLFGVGMRGMISNVEGSDYMSYILPGIIALSALGGAVGGGIVLLDERLRGITKEYLVAPIPRLSILLGNASSTATKAMIQAAIMLVVGVLMGARLSLNPFGWIAALLLLALFAIGFSGLALAVAAISRSIMGYHGMIFLFNLPLLFASNALYPLSVLPGWMRVIVMLNPTTYLVDAVRALAFGVPATLPLLLSVAVVLLFAVLGTWLALSLFQRSVLK